MVKNITERGQHWKITSTSHEPVWATRSHTQPWCPFLAGGGHHWDVAPFSFSHIKFSCTLMSFASKSSIRSFLSGPLARTTKLPGSQPWRQATRMSGVLFMSDGKMAQGMGRLFGAASVPKRCGEELNHQFSIYCSVYGYELWVVTKTTKMSLDETGWGVELPLIEMVSDHDAFGTPPLRKHPCWWL